MRQSSGRQSWTLPKEAIFCNVVVPLKTNYKKCNISLPALVIGPPKM
jgi:hypothetical protein